jgi:uncharacterized protein
MLLPVLLSGFMLGAAGSMHCMGMCGPLSLALPSQHLTPAKKTISLLLYQAGRIVTYSLIGLVVGLAGHRIYLAGYQHWFSIAAGFLIIALTILYVLRKRAPHFWLINRFYQLVQRILIKILRSSPNAGGFFLMGMANGLLPCGMVYIALASTMSLPGVGESVGFMAMFGAGTLPAMMIVAYAGQVMKFETRIVIRKAVPFLMASMGILLILRGLNLGIPYISPQLPAEVGQPAICHP